jgi:hypothetical protein
MPTNREEPRLHLTPASSISLAGYDIDYDKENEREVQYEQ